MAGMSFCIHSIGAAMAWHGAAVPSLPSALLPTLPQARNSHAAWACFSAVPTSPLGAFRGGLRAPTFSKTLRIYGYAGAFQRFLVVTPRDMQA